MATATSMRVNAEAALLSRDGRNIRIGLAISQNLLPATSFQLLFVEHFTGHVNPADVFLDTNECGLTCWVAGL